MNNLKRVLSLALASVMLIGMMAVGASAADVSEFSDGEKITHTDAVATMATLGVIEGNTDGTYAPERILKRGEMTAIIARLLNGGVNPSLGTATSPLFTDVVNHWSRPYVEYCANLGIVAGMGDGTFRPEDTLTGSQAAKMLLCAAGYKSDIYKFTGNEWELNVNRVASQQGLYKELGNVTVNTTAGLKRDDAAQMAYNTLDVTPIVETYSQDLATGNTTVQYVKDTAPNDTMLGKYFGATAEEGVMKNASYDSDTKLYTYVFDDGTAFGKIGAVAAADLLGTLTFTSDKDYTDLFGQRVKVTYKDSKTVLGMYDTSKKVIETTVGAMTAPSDTSSKSVAVGSDSVALEGAYSATKEYKLFDNTNAAANLGTDTAKATAVKLVSVDANSKIDYAIVTPAVVGKVTYKNSSTVTVDNGVGNKTLSSLTVYDGLAVNDWVIYVDKAYTLPAKATLTKLDTVSGTVESLRDTDVKIDGKWYKKVSGTTPSVGKEATLTVVGNWYYDVETPDTTSLENILYVSKAAKTTAGGLSGNAVEAVVYFADGTKKTVTINQVHAKTPTDVDASLANYDAGNVDKIMVGAFYTFKEKDGKYQVTELKSTNLAGFESYDSKATANASFKHDGTKPYVVGTTNGTCVIADDAVVFVTSTDATNGAAEVITGKDLKAYAADFGDTAMFLTKDVNGVATAKVIALIDDAVLPTTSGAKNYGYVVANTTYTEKNKVSYAEMTIWNGSEKVSVLAESLDSKDTTNSTATGTETTPTAALVKTLDAAQKGAFVSYDLLPNGNVSNVTELTTANVAIKGTFTDEKGQTNLVLLKDGDKDDTTFSGTAAKEAYGIITSKTKIIYVDTNDVVGADGGEIALATETAISGYYVPNAVIAYSTNADVLFVDVTNSLGSNGSDYTLAVGSDYTGAGVGTASGKTSKFYLGGQTIPVAKVGIAAADDAVSFTDTSDDLLAVKVLKGNQSSVTTNLVAGNIIRIVTTDGTVTDLTVTTGAIDS